MTCQTPYTPTSSYLSTVVYDGDGSTTSFAYNFDYLNKSTWAQNSPNTTSTTYNAYLTVLVGGVAVNYTMSNAYTLVLETAPAAGDSNVAIRRNSSISSRKVDYVEGSVLTESNLDRDSKQAFFLSQELHDRMLDISCTVESASYINSYYFDSVSGSQSNFDLSTAASGGVSEETALLAKNELLVLLNGTIQQARTTNYVLNLVGGVLRVTFASPPAMGTNVEIRTIASGISQRVNIGTGDVGTAELADSAVTYVKTDFNAAGSDNTFLGQRAGLAGWYGVTASDVSGLNAYIVGKKVTDFTAPTSSFNMNSQKITNLLTPSATGDAANKYYVDTVAATNYAPSFKMERVDVANTDVTVTCAFNWDFADILIKATPIASIGDTVATSYAAADLASYASFSFAQVSGGGSFYTIRFIKTGSSLVMKQTGASSSASISVFVKLYANAAGV